jgi:hypothetical protein
VSKTLYMETTEVSAERTAAEIMGVLAGAPNVRRVTQTYDASGGVVGVEFEVAVGMLSWCYRLPVREEPVFQILNGRRDSWNKSAKRDQDRQQARRVAWRQVLRWVQAQLALIETGMAKPEEVFMPYMLNEARDRTYFEAFADHQVKMLEAAKA